ncbi:SUF system Fe-S cluster assembly regulator [Temperatibacter marinus]|uniref:SUF system Fe-S cluster assembly regulator n=1 Tax=Temperatibacter marinus TaxID=1456591 RepID=A0AA52EK98_9PROT|nr:SUF system Fe-S cluster assembly regulator [Temperatibacter marinus]WND03779.1 SUF system Fe-S cluster assembly regulator [Temperatibacter marinus]
MIRLTNLADYAVLLMAEIAKGFEEKNLYSAQGLSNVTKIPATTVSKILNLLGKADLLISTRGLKGGFTLARSKDEISMTDIIEAIDGPISLTHCVSTTKHDCSYEEMCGMRPHWVMINQTIREGLDKISLASIETPKAGLALNALLDETMETAAE